LNFPMTIRLESPQQADVPAFMKKPLQVAA
jgi:hypothetical protein